MSKNNNTGLISMSDFERGLVLAGLISPRSLQEFEDIEALQTFEKQRNEMTVVAKPVAQKEPRNIYFKRAVLAAEIVSALHNEPTFGRIKFQKLFYLCEHIVFSTVQEKYQKQAAGPFDNKFMHSIVHEFKRQNWFRVETVQSGNYNKSVYTPLTGCDKYKPYYKKYFQANDENIQQTLNLFRKKDTVFTEISATLFFCYKEMTGQACPYTEEELLSRFYSFSERKAMFDKSQVLHNWNWMQQVGIITLP